MDQLSYENFAPVTDAARKRDDGRDSLLLGAMMRTPEMEPRQVRVRNLSRGGLMAEVNGMIDVGDPVQIEVRGIGWVKGHIAWAAEGRVGVAFDRPVDPLRARRPVSGASGK